MPQIAIFTIGLDIVSLTSVDSVSRLDIKLWSRQFIPIKSTFLLFVFSNLLNLSLGQNIKPLEINTQVITGAEQTERYIPLLKNKKVALLTNTSGKIKHAYLLDTLLRLRVNVVKVFGPEHGFRSSSDASRTILDEVDSITGIPVVSLYGKNKKPKPEQLAGIELVVYDLQDVGVRYYTYISTLSYMIEACAELRIPVLILDRPNPNGFYIDGPVLESDCNSFLGRFPIPVVYGMTCGELAQMMIGEHWLSVRETPSLTVIPLKGYNRNKTCRLETAPSPNLKDLKSVLFYPSLGWMEGTCLSLGRGTPGPFKQFGHPEYAGAIHSFIPVPNAINTHPRYAFKTCYGISLDTLQWLKHHPRKIELSWILQAYNSIPSQVPFFESSFDAHSGTKQLQLLIKNGASEAQIRSGWKKNLDLFKKRRQRYLLYPDFKNS